MRARINSFQLLFIAMLFSSLNIIAFAGMESLSKQQTSQVQQKLGLKQFSAQSLTLPDKADADLKIIVTKDGKQKTLRLRKNSVRAKNFRVRVQLADGSLAEVTPPEPLTYRGTIDDELGTIVVGSLLPEGFSVNVYAADKKTWHIQPMQDIDIASARALHIVYDGENLTDDPGTCGTDDHQHRPAVTEKEDNTINAITGSCTKVCQLAYDADYEYYELNSLNVNNVIADIENVTNSMEVIYAHDTLITYEITDIIVRTDPNDPYTESGASALLTEFRNYWNSNHGTVERDLAHLMTGRNIDSSTIGIAYIGVVCSRNYGYGLSQTRFSSNMSRRVALTAHEVGHNWSAGHANSEDDAGIMCSSLGGCGGNVTSFSQASIDSITNHKNSRNCLADGTGATDPVEPIVLDDNAGSIEGAGPFAIDVLANDQDGNCDVLNIPDFNATSVSGGQITKGTGAQGQDIMLYSPPASFSGVDSFFYLATDSTGMGGWAMVTVTVTASRGLTEDELRDYLLGVVPIPSSDELALDGIDVQALSLADLMLLVKNKN